MYHKISVVFKMGGACFTAYLMSAWGVHKVSTDTFSWMVSTLIACCVASRCLAPLGIAFCAGGSIADCVTVRGGHPNAGSVFMLAISGIGWTR